MSFTKKITTDSRVSYPQLQLTLPAEQMEVEATITVTGVSGLSGDLAIAEYQVTVSGITSSILRSEFQYSGEGDPIEEAETYLERYCIK